MISMLQETDASRKEEPYRPDPLGTRVEFSKEAECQTRMERSVSNS